MAKVSDQGDFMSHFITTHRVPDDARKHFAAIPWTNAHLSSPLYTAIPTFSRVLKDTGEDYFFSRTVSSPSTIPHLISLQLKSFPSLSELPAGTPLPTTTHKSSTPVPATPDTIFLLSLGHPGLDGHPSVIHGGMACAILDEMMGLCVMLHHQQYAGARDSLFTVNLNVTYRAPVPTPGEVLVRCWLVARQGRKWLSRGQIVSKEGKVLTEGEGMWVLTTRDKKL